MDSTADAVVADPTVFNLTLPPRYPVRETLKRTRDTCGLRVHNKSARRDEALKILTRDIADPQEILRFKTEFRTLEPVSSHLRDPRTR